MARRMIAIILALIMVFAMTPTAYAMSVSVGNATAGNSVSVSWSGCPSDISHYEYSVRDLTTDNLIYNRSGTTGTSFSIPGSEIIAGHEYRVWVGGIRVGSSEVPAEYQSTVTFSVRGCSHANIYERALSQKTKSISDTEHRHTFTWQDVCTDCGEYIGSTYETKKTERHTLNSNGDCTVCDYRSACTHDRTRKVAAEEWYESVSASQHKHITLFNRVCQDCDDVVGTYLTDSSLNESENESHRFRSGACRDCGYVKAEDLTVSVSSRPSSANTGETLSASASAKGGEGGYDYAWQVYRGHTIVEETDYSMGSSYSYTPSTAGSYRFQVFVRDAGGNTASASGSLITVVAVCQHEAKATLVKTTYSDVAPGMHNVRYDYENNCKHCGMYMNAFKNEATEPHTYPGGANCVCGRKYVCPHAQTHPSVQAAAYLSVSADKHRTTYTYQDVCDVCYTNIGQTYTERVEEAHVFDRNGDCEVCDYRVQCRHTRKQLVPQSDGVTVVSDQEHKRTTVNDEVCADCRAVLRKYVPIDVVEAHSFVGGTCSACGYSRQPLSVSIQITPQSGSLGQTVRITASANGGGGSYQYAWQVYKNGSIVHETAYSRGGSYSYTLDTIGEYAFGVYAQDKNGAVVSARSGSVTVTCSHAITYKASQSTKYEFISDDMHKVIQTYTVCCRACQAPLRDGTDETTKKHAYDAAGICACGHEVELICPKHGVAHQYRSGYEIDHDHKIFMKCACGDWYYTGKTLTNKVKVCEVCYPPEEEEKPAGGTDDENTAGIPEHEHDYKTYFDSNLDSYQYCTICAPRTVEQILQDILNLQRYVSHLAQQETEHATQNVDDWKMQLSEDELLSAMQTNIKYNRGYVDQVFDKQFRDELKDVAEDGLLKVYSAIEGDASAVLVTTNLKAGILVDQLTEPYNDSPVNFDWAKTFKDCLALVGFESKLIDDLTVIWLENDFFRDVDVVTADDFANALKEYGSPSVMKVLGSAADFWPIIESAMNAVDEYGKYEAAITEMGSENWSRLTDTLRSSVAPITKSAASILDVVANPSERLNYVVSKNIDVGNARDLLAKLVGAKLTVSPPLMPIVVSYEASTAFNEFLFNTNDTISAIVATQNSLEISDACFSTLGTAWSIYSNSPTEDNLHALKMAYYACTISDASLFSSLGKFGEANADATLTKIHRFFGIENKGEKLAELSDAASKLIYSDLDILDMIHVH